MVDGLKVVDKSKANYWSVEFLSLFNEFNYFRLGNNRSADRRSKSSSSIFSMATGNMSAHVIRRHSFSSPIYGEYQHQNHPPGMTPLIAAYRGHDEGQVQSHNQELKRNATPYSGGPKELDSSACGQHFVSFDGEISNPEYPDFRPDPIFCQWHIRSPSAFRIQIIFTLLDLQFNRDYLDIEITRDGEKITKIVTGDKLPERFVLASPETMVTLRSDIPGTKPRFRFNFQETRQGKQMWQYIILHTIPILHTISYTQYTP